MRRVTVGLLLRKELRDALRNRWLWLFAAAFGSLALALGLLGLGELAGTLGFSRTAAGLINLSLLVVPLFALVLGAQGIAGERERRTLPYLLAQPLSRFELLLGKYLGLGVALAAAVALGFGLAAIPLALVRLDVRVYLAVAGLSLLLALAMLSLGLLCSVVARRASLALGVALVAWFGLVLAADLGLMGTTLALRLRADVVFLLALANPLQVFKLAAVLAIRPSLDVLGPAGLYGASTLGGWLGPLLGAILVGWAIVPLGLASLLFARRAEP